MNCPFCRSGHSLHKVHYSLFGRGVVAEREYNEEDLKDNIMAYCINSLCKCYYEASYVAVKNGK